MNIKDYFDIIDINTINQFIDCSQEENLNLEFKILNMPDFSHRDDKKNFAKALSGFANSDGGLLVWGVEAKKNKQGIDCATAIKEIERVQLFLSRLNEFTGMAVSPTVNGVEHKLIQTSESGGIVVTLIPESDIGPHMAKLGEDRYYKRSGDSFYKMEHYDLQDMFGHRKKAKLVLVHSVRNKGVNPSIVISIRNDGRGSARAPYLALEVNTPYRLSNYGVDGNMNFGMRRLRHAGPDFPHRFGEDSSFVIHPGITHDVTVIDLGIYPDRMPNCDLQIKYMITAEDIRLEVGILTVSLNELV